MAISKVVYGDDTLIDITDSTVSANNMLNGTVGYDSAGVRTVGSVSIPTVNDNTITIKENGNTVDTFTLNQSSDKNIDIPVNQSYYGTCTDAGTVANKTVTVSNQNFKLVAGALINVKFDNANSATNVKLNVNGTGNKSIWYNGSVYENSSANVCGYTNRITTYVYDGTYWIWVTTGVVIDSNTHRPINVNGTELLGNNATAVNFKNGSNVTITGSGANVTIAATDTTYTATKENIGSASAGTAIAADDITAWTTNTPTVVTKKTVVTGGSTTNVPNITKKTVVTAATYANGILTISTGDSVDVGTPIKAYTNLNTGDSVDVTAGTAATLTYQARSIPNISVTSKSVVTGITAN